MSIFDVMNGGIQRKRSFESEFDGFSSTPPNTAIATAQQNVRTNMVHQTFMPPFPPTPANHRKNNMASHATMTFLLLIAISIVSASAMSTAAAASSKNTTNDSSIDDENATQFDNRTVPSSDRIFSSKNESESDASTFIVELGDGNDEESSAAMSANNDDEGMEPHCMHVTYFKIH